MAHELSVIVPIYNMASFIPEGVASLKQQHGVEFEVILVNDGSKDDSAAVCEREIAGDARFRLISTENRGSGPARNTGVEHATGEYLYFFDIDDWLEPDALTRMVARAREAACDLLVFGYTTQLSRSETPKAVAFDDVRVDGAAARRDYAPYMNGRTMIQGAPWNKLFRRDVVNAHQIEYPALRRNQDEVFLMRYMQHAASVRIVPDVLYHHLKNSLERTWLKYRLEYAENVEELFGFYRQIILAWNPDNEGVKRILFRQYFICELIALRVLYNPKWKLAPPAIYRRLKQLVRRWKQNSRQYLTDPMDPQTTKSKLFPYMEGERYMCLYLIFGFKALYRRLTGK